MMVHDDPHLMLAPSAVRVAIRSMVLQLFGVIIPALGAGLGGSVCALVESEVAPTMARFAEEASANLAGLVRAGAPKGA